MTLDDNVELLAQQLAGMTTAMLVSHGKDGHLKARPMRAQPTVFDGALWFFTAAVSAKAEELAGNERVCLTYSDPALRRFVSVSGRATVVVDPDKARELWTPTLQAWFTGADDPSLRLIRIEVDEAAFWNRSDDTQVELHGFSRTALNAPPDVAPVPVSNRTSGPSLAPPDTPGGWHAES